MAYLSGLSGNGRINTEETIRQFPRTSNCHLGCRALHKNYWVILKFVYSSLTEDLIVLIANRRPSITTFHLSLCQSASVCRPADQCPKSSR